MKSQQLLEKIFASLHEAVFVLDDETGQIVDCNAAAIKMFGYDRQEMIGALPIITHVDEAALEEFRRLLYIAVKEKGFLFLPEFALKRKDGTIFPAEHHVMPLEDEKGNIIGWVSAVTDISERKASEEALRQSHETARRLAQENAILAEIGRIISSTLEIEDVYERFVEEARKLFSFKRISVIVINEDNNTFTIAHTAGIEFPGRFQGATFPLADTIAGEILRTRSSFLFREADANESKIPFRDTQLAFQAGFRAAISVPLISKNRVIGILHLLSNDPNAYSQKDLRLAERVGDQIAGAIASARLFADLWKAEEALRAEKKKFQILVENAPFGMLMADKHHNNKYLNPKFKEVFGYDISDIPNAEAWFKKTLLNPAHWDKTISTWERDLESLKEGKAVSRNIKAICKDGRERIVNIAAVHLEKGEYLLACEDITDRERAEEELRESEERYRTAIEHCNDGVLIARGGKNLFVNWRFVEIFGYSHPEEIVGKPFSSMVHSGNIKVGILLSSFPQCEKCQGGAVVPHQHEIKGIRKNGDLVDIETSSTPIAYRGEPACLVYVRDVTERKMAEKERAELQQQVRQSQKMEAIGRLAGGIAHDFNNLLTVIKGYAELALLELKEGDPLKNDIEEIQKASKRASDLTRQLLAFGRRQLMEMKIVNLNILVSNLDSMLRRVIGEDIELVTLLAAGLGVVKADPGQIEQVIMNLAVNARDAMPGGGKLTIETTNVEMDDVNADAHDAFVPGRYVMISVSDTGCGMPPEIRERIFEPFFTTKKKGEGTGLGLSMADGIVKQSGGTIRTYSEPGKGTTFNIYLPRIDGIHAERTERTKHREIQQGNETILVVEDEKSVKELATKTLGRQGYSILEAGDGQEAISICEKHNEPIHMILTDVVMPRMSGPQLVKRLREVRNDFKVLYMSGYTDDIIVSNDMLENKASYIQKPFTLEALANKVRDVLDH